MTSESLQRSTASGPMTISGRDIVLACKGVGHHFGKKPILADINLEIERGDIVALVGPSGCGKSTLLRAILGTDPPKTGKITMNGVPYRRPSRHCGIVYQRYSLFPFLTAEGNVAIGPLLDRTTMLFRWFRPFRTRRFHRVLARHALHLLRRMKLSDSAHHYPQALSGGMQQRVAIAQALIMKPQVLLLDEPFGALDEATREELQTMLLELYAINREARRRGERPRYTLLIVTHELNEAIFVANRVLGLSQFHRDGRQGATIVYDKSAPIFAPGQLPDLEQFRGQRDEIRQVVFDPESKCHRDEHVTYWRECGSG